MLDGSFMRAFRLPPQLKKKNSCKNPTFSVNQKQQLRRVNAGCEEDADAAAQTGPRSRCRLTGALAASALLHRRRGGGASGSTAAGLMKCFCSNLSRLKLKIKKEWGPALTQEAGDGSHTDTLININCVFILRLSVCARSRGEVRVVLLEWCVSL